MEIYFIKRYLIRIDTICIYRAILTKKKLYMFFLKLYLVYTCVLLFYQSVYVYIQY